jgi:superfamily II DNA or RNA helicase
VKPLAQRCAAEFDPGDRSRGEGYFRQHRVRLTPADENGVGAEVSGSSAPPYTVLIDWSETHASDDLVAYCDCRRFADGYPCKHLWATLLAVDAAGGHGHVPGTGPLGVVVGFELILDDEDTLDEDDDWTGEWDDDFEYEGAAWLADHEPGGSDAGSWRRQLQKISHTLLLAEESRPWYLPGETPRRVELWLEIDLDAILRSGRLTIDLYQREEKLSGGMGVLKPLGLDEERAARLSDAADRELAALLLALGEGGAGESGGWYPRYATYRPPVRTVRVPAGLYDTLLPRFASEGRLGWWDRSKRRPDVDDRLSWDDGPPWRLALRLHAATDTGPARLEGVLARDGETVPLTSPLLLLADGLVLFRDRLARLDVAGDFVWISWLRQLGDLEIPREEIPDALRTLGAMAALPPLVLDDDLPVASESPAPRPGVSIEGVEPTGEGARIRAELFFRYGDQRVADGEPRSVLIGAGAGADGAGPAEEVRLLRRDLEAEAEARRTVLDLGAAPDPGGRALFLPVEGLGIIVDALLDAGWRVEARGGRLRRAGGLSLTVSSGIDWFDLEGGLDFDGESVALPRLLEAAARGQDYVELGDGSLGMLPSEWLERFTPLAGLASEAPAGGDGSTLRFLPSQALLLDALLSATPTTLRAELQVDEGFARLRDRLTGGHQVAPRAEPDGFVGELRPYQRQGLGWLSFLAEVGLGGCLADDMGLGKTIQVLALLLARKAEGEVSRPTLVVAPRSLVYNWLDEAARFAPGLVTLDYTGTGRKAQRERFGEVDLVVTTYGTMRRDAAALAEIRFDHAILDEAQAIKNASSQTAKAARLLRADHRLVLTGTPVENRLSELGSLFEFLNPGMLGRSSRVQALLEPNRNGEAEDGSALADVARALGPFILRRTKAEVLPDLPAKTEQTLLVTLPKRQRSLYDELRDHYRARLTDRIGEAGLAKSKMHVLEALLRLRQAACHPGLVDAERADEESAKLEALSEQLGEVLDEGHKALVFSQFTSLLALVRRRLDRQGVAYEYLDGRTRDRAARVKRFQTDPDCRLFLISLKAGGTGLNLTAADYVFLLDPWWNPAVEAQAVDRAHRIGQQRPVIAYRLIARDTVEEKILELQKSKRELADAVLAESGAALRKLTVEDLELLLS